MKLWPKCGLTSDTRRDATLVELPDVRRWMIVTFTTGYSGERNIIPAIVAGILRA